MITNSWWRISVGLRAAIEKVRWRTNEDQITAQPENPTRVALPMCRRAAPRPATVTPASFPHVRHPDRADAPLL